MRRVTVAVACTAAFALGACGTTEKSGQGGQTLSDGGLKVGVLKVERPRPGQVGVRVRACTDDDQAVKSYDFQLRRSGGDTVRPQYVATTYSDRFPVTRSGCGDGWLVFEIRRADRAEAVKFSYDDTGNNRQPGREKHTRFTWNLD